MVADPASQAERPPPRRAAVDAEPAPGCRTIGVAIPIPDPYGSDLQRRRESYGDPLASSIPTHITLLPPTEVAIEALPEIVGHLVDVAEAGRSFSIRLRGTGTFRPVSPVVFVALGDGIGGCEQLQRRVLAGPLLRDLSFPYHPHVTVAHDLPNEVLDRAFKDLNEYRAEFDVPGFALYEHGADRVWRPRHAFVFPR